MKVKVHVTLKQGVLDPQGKAIQHALQTLGFDNVDNVRQGKFIELDINSTDKEQVAADTDKMCKQLLTNTVIENYSIDIE